MLSFHIRKLVTLHYIYNYVANIIQNQTRFVTTGMF